VIVLDTNVVSELMKAAPGGSVRDWNAAKPATSLYTALRPHCCRTPPRGAADLALRHADCGDR